MYYLGYFLFMCILQINAKFSMLQKPAAWYHYGIQNIYADI